MDNVATILELIDKTIDEHEGEAKAGGDNKSFIHEDMRVEYGNVRCEEAWRGLRWGTFGTFILGEYTDCQTRQMKLIIKASYWPQQVFAYWVSRQQRPSCDWK